MTARATPTEQEKVRDHLNKRESKASIMRRLLRDATKQKRLPSIADALEFRREAYGLTAREFAQVLGIAGTHYSEVVHGKRRLPIDAVRRAVAVGVPVDILLQPFCARSRHRASKGRER